MHHSTNQIVMRFQVADVAAETAERYNIAPTQSVPVVTTTTGDRKLEALQWGLIPAWAKDPGIANKLINARAETLAEKPSFKQALVRRRCIIPADGFYEWKREGNARQPMHFKRVDGDLFGFAGLWEEWKQPYGSPLRTCTIITTTPNSLAAQVHDRMPAILRPEDEALWLDAALTNVPDLLQVLRSYPADEMEVFAVSKRVNAPVIDDLALLNPV
jgi:putative SOS response-associated peptidase YedK